MSTQASTSHGIRLPALASFQPVRRLRVPSPRMPSSSGSPTRPPFGPVETASSTSFSLAETYATYVVRVHTRHGIKTLSFDTLATLFTHTAKSAAEELGISSRTLIRVCRSLGIRRWPYLGFRSEKNVDRIRQEAIENLRRKLEREGPNAAMTVLDSDESCARGASAKRLLQVQVQQPPSPSFVGNTEPLQYMEQRISPTHWNSPSWNAPTAPTPAWQVALHTPPPVQQHFNLEVPRLSPRKAPEPILKPLRSIVDDRTHAMPEKRIPSLHVLVDASILTSMKHDATCQNDNPAPRPSPVNLNSKMSMRDILTTTATTA